MESEDLEIEVGAPGISRWKNGWFIGRKLVENPAFYGQRIGVLDDQRKFRGRNFRVTDF